MMGILLTMLGVLAALGLMLTALAGFERACAPPAELTRKMLHVGMGLLAMGFPWLFEQRWPVVVLAGLALVGMGAVRFMPALRLAVGRVVHGVARPGLGELYYPLAAGTLWWLSYPDVLLFVIPMLLLTVGDAVAALIGLRYGTLPYLTSQGHKSAEGTFAMFLVGFLGTHVPVLLFTDVGRAEALLLGLIVGLLVALIEAIVTYGSDNLFIPLGTFALLSLYLDQTAGELGYRLVATVALVVFALAWRWRSELNDSALMAAAFFGYAAWMIGGPLWLLAPGVLFLIHALAWPRVHPQHRYQPVLAVVSVVGAGLIWLLLHAAWNEPALIYPYAVSFAAHFSIVGASRLIWSPVSSRQAWGWLIGYATAGWIGCALPSFALARALGATPLSDWMYAVMIALALAVSLTAGLSFYALRWFMYEPEPRPITIHAIGGTIGLVGSLLAGLPLVVNG